MQERLTISTGLNGSEVVRLSLAVVSPGCLGEHVIQMAACASGGSVDGMEGVVEMASSDGGRFGVVAINSGGSSWRATLPILPRSTTVCAVRPTPTAPN